MTYGNRQRIKAALMLAFELAAMAAALFAIIGRSMPAGP